MFIFYINTGQFYAVVKSVLTKLRMFVCIVGKQSVFYNVYVSCIHAGTKVHMVALLCQSLFEDEPFEAFSIQNLFFPTMHERNKYKPEPSGDGETPRHML